MIINNVELAKHLGLWQKYHKDDEEVQQDIKDYPILGATVTFAFGTNGWDKDYEFEIQTKFGLKDAWEQAAEKIMEGLRHSIVSGMKLSGD